MDLTKKDVEHVAKLARLALTDQEKDRFAGQLGNILSYIEKLQQLDTSNVAATAHPFFTKTVWREDGAERSAVREEILNNAPEREEDFFKVRKVIE